MLAKKAHLMLAKRCSGLRGHHTRSEGQDLSKACRHFGIFPLLGQSFSFVLYSFAKFSRLLCHLYGVFHLPTRFIFFSFSSVISSRREQRFTCFTSISLHAYNRRGQHPVDSQGRNNHSTKQCNESTATQVPHDTARETKVPKHTRTTQS
jgi:hypothetical protein